MSNPYKNKWFADPFILEEDDENIQFLVEEFDYSVGRGRIARLMVNKKDNEIKECSIILDLPTHLSFRLSIMLMGKYMFIRRTPLRGGSYIYRYDKVADKLVEPKLMVNEPIADAIILKDGDNYRMYATRVPDTNGCTIHEYVSNTLF